MLAYMKQHSQTDLTPWAAPVQHRQKRRVNSATRPQAIASPSRIPEEGSGMGTESTWKYTVPMDENALD